MKNYYLNYIKVIYYKVLIPNSCFFQYAVSILMHAVQIQNMSFLKNINTIKELCWTVINNILKENKKRWAHICSYCREKKIYKWVFTNNNASFPLIRDKLLCIVKRFLKVHSAAWSYSKCYQKDIQRKI